MNEIDELSKKIEVDPKNVALLEARALKYYKRSRYHDSYNDFVVILEIDPNYEKARQYLNMLSGLMGYEYKENINV